MIPETATIRFSSALMDLDAAMQRSARLIERFQELRAEIEIVLMVQKRHLADRERLRGRIDALRRQVP